MLPFPRLFDWRNWRWRFVTSALPAKQPHAPSPKSIPDAVGAEALSAAEYEGWPLAPNHTRAAAFLRMAPNSN